MCFSLHLAFLSSLTKMKKQRQEDPTLKLCSIVGFVTAKLEEWMLLGNTSAPYVKDKAAVKALKMQRPILPRNL